MIKEINLDHTIHFQDKFPVQELKEKLSVEEVDAKAFHTYLETTEKYLSEISKTFKYFISECRLVDYDYIELKFTSFSNKKKLKKYFSPYMHFSGYEVGALDPSMGDVDKAQQLKEHIFKNKLYLDLKVTPFFIVWNNSYTLLTPSLIDFSISEEAYSILSMSKIEIDDLFE